MVYPTAEVRWFWPGEMPQPVFDWLSGWRVPPEVQPVRTDHYARLPAGIGETMGIKLREGRLEIKWRQKERGIVRLAPGASGAVEFWRKQSFAASEAGGIPVAGLALAGDAISVEKVRRLARFQVGDDGQVVDVQQVEPGAGMCEFEVTAVCALGQVWWTACFEACGAGDAVLERTLLRVAAHVLAAPQPLTANAEHSLSYPQWLARLDPAG